MISLPRLRVRPALFDVLLRHGVAVGEAEHLSTLQGMVGHELDGAIRNGEIWVLMQFDTMNEPIWLPMAAMEHEERT